MPTFNAQEGNRGPEEVSEVAKGHGELEGWIGARAPMSRPLTMKPHYNHCLVPVAILIAH